MSRCCPLTGFLCAICITVYPDVSAQSPEAPKNRKSKEGPIIDLNTEFYEVRGNSSQRLKKEMDRYGPRQDGEAFYALLCWFVEWRYTFSVRGDSCAIDSAQVKVRATMILPRWNPPRNASERLVSQWQDFHEALEEHENGHLDHGIAAGYEVLAALGKLMSPSCETIEEIANSRAGKIIDKHNRADRKYDVETQHGIKQGAVWPPRPR